MEITTQIKKRFCKDFKLPINVYQEPYYEYFTQLYDNHYGITEKTKWLNEVLKNCNNQEDFFANSEKVSTAIKKMISETKAYENFNKANIEKEFPKTEQVSQQNIYIVPNIGKKMISIDLDKANFNCFRLFGLQEELKINTYKDLIKEVTDYDYFVNSKMIRQVIFGDLNPKRQQSIQKYIINKLCTSLLKEGCKLSSASSDEIIVSNDISVAQVKDILSHIPQELQFFRVEEFQFEKIAQDKDFFNTENKVESMFVKKTITEDGTEKLEFKSVPAHLHAQVFKKYYNLEVNEKDLTFYYEGFLAQFKEPLYHPVSALNETKKMKIK